MTGVQTCALPIFALARENTLPAAGPGVWLAMLGVGMLCTAIAYILYYRLIADLGPVRSLTVTFLIPPFGIVWGAMFLGEQLSWAHVAGGALIGLAVWLVLRPTAPVAAGSTAVPGPGRS